MCHEKFLLVHLFLKHYIITNEICLPLNTARKFPSPTYLVPKIPAGVMVVKLCQLQVHSYCEIFVLFCAENNQYFIPYNFSQISDFGSAVENYVTSSAGVTHQFHKGGTVTHFAPELVRAEGGKYNTDEKSDMWRSDSLQYSIQIYPIYCYAFNTSDLCPRLLS